MLSQGCLCCLLFAHFTGPFSYNLLIFQSVRISTETSLNSDGHILVSSRPSHWFFVLFGFNWIFNCSCCVGNRLKWIFTYSYSLRLYQILNMPVVKHPDERDKGVTPISSEMAVPLDGYSVN